MSDTAANLEAALAWQALDRAGLDYVSPDWLDRTRSPAVMRWLMESRKTRHLVAKQLCADFQLEPLPDPAVGGFAANLLRQGPAFVQSLAMYVGYVGYSQVIRRSIDGRFKRAFWELVGEQGYAFISKRAAFYNPGLVARFVPPLQTGTSLNQSDVVVAGLSALRAVTNDSGPATARRLNLMFPVTILEALRQHPEVTVDEKELSILSRVVEKLVSELSGTGS
jgi:hypothetical protein